VIKDPVTGLPFANNQIPADRISPVSKAALQYLWPLPNTGPANAIANNYSFKCPPHQQQSGRFPIDHNISSGKRGFLRGTYKSRSVYNVNFAQAVVAGAAYQPERDISLTAAHNFVFPTADQRIADRDERRTRPDQHRCFGQGFVGKIGVLPDPRRGHHSGVHHQWLQTTGTATSSVSDPGAPVAGQLSWTSGPHTLKFGGAFARRAFISVMSLPLIGPANTPSTDRSRFLIGNPYAAFLRDTRPTGIGLVNVADSNGHAVHYAFYVQDDFNIIAADDQLWNAVGISSAVSRRSE
jgi:hypothetical protein